MEPGDLVAASGVVAGKLEPFHSMIYFAPEADELYVVAGLQPGPMGYFASRAAALGPVGPAVVAALFYNFHPGRVAQFLPAAWSLAEPADLLTARYAAADAALHRLLGPEVLGSPEMAEAAQLARRAAEACPIAGRPMAAALLELPWPTPAPLVLWHAISVLREHRGDGHVAVLDIAGLSGIEALVSFTATGTGHLPEVARASRGWSAPEWTEAEAGLRERGLIDADAALTQAGRQTRAGIEADTDRLGHHPWATLGAAGTHRLGEIGSRLVATLLAHGAFPENTFGPRSTRNPVEARRRAAPAGRADATR